MSRHPQIRRLLLSASLLGLASASVSAAHAFAGSDLSKDAKILIETARATALQARPGQITDEELEAEAGGSGLRYSFVIAAKTAQYEVGVDAKTGLVLENSKEGRNPD